MSLQYQELGDIKEIEDGPPVVPVVQNEPVIYVQPVASNPNLFVKTEQQEPFSQPAIVHPEETTQTVEVDPNVQKVNFVPLYILLIAVVLFVVGIFGFWELCLVSFVLHMIGGFGYLKAKNKKTRIFACSNLILAGIESLSFFAIVMIPVGLGLIFGGASICAFCIFLPCFLIPLLIPVIIVIAMICTALDEDWEDY